MLVGMSAPGHLAGGTMMDDKIRRKIAEAAAKEKAWNVDDVRVDEVERLRRPRCSFYTAANTAAPLSYVRNYALFNEEVTPAGDGKVVAHILDKCSKGASANWWAEIIARFYNDLGNGQVLVDENTRPDIVRKLSQAGKDFARPVLDRKKQSVRFLLLNRETYVVYRVETERKGSGPVEVSKTELLAP